jgi:YggT family protein
MHALLKVLIAALDLYWWVLIASVVLSWLIGFNVVNIRNDMVRSIWTAVEALTEPVLRPIRRFLPNLGGIDISPIIVLLLLAFLRQLLVDVLYSYPYAL